MEVAFESLSAEVESDVGSRLDQIARRCEERIGERNGVAYGAADSGMQLSNEGDVHQGWPGNTACDSPCPGVDSFQLVVGEQVVGPLLRGVDRNRSNRNSIEPHNKNSYLFSIYLIPAKRGYFLRK